MKTLILDNYDSFTYNLFQYLSELGACPEVKRNNEITLEEIEKNGYTHIVISPGPGSPDNEKDFGICGKVIQKFSDRIPILGVCLGHQGIIHHLGGKIMRAPVPMHGKRSVVRIKNTHALFRGLPEEIEAMRYHSLIGEKETLPKDLEIIGETDPFLIMAVAHRSKPLFGVQFHPESIGTHEGKQILKNFLEIKPAVEPRQSEKLLDDILAGKFSEEEVAVILTELAKAGETIPQIVGMASSLRKHAVAIPLKDEILMDTCGTGGSGLPRMNISTAAAFVLAACGVKIAKHGNRGSGVRCGSFDLLETLGVNIALSPEAVAKSIRTLNVGFLFAPLFHPAMKLLAPIRKKLGIRTIFNLLGPLSNPASPRYHLLGTTSRETAEKMIEAMKSLPYIRAMVVVGEDGLDDVTVTGKTFCYELLEGKVRNFEFIPEQAGIPRAKNFKAISGGSPQHNAELFMLLLQGKAPTDLQNLLFVNAAFALYVRGFASKISIGLEMAKNVIYYGKALEKFITYRDFSQTFLQP